MLITIGFETPLALKLPFTEKKYYTNHGRITEED